MEASITVPCGPVTAAVTLSMTGVSTVSLTSASVTVRVSLPVRGAFASVRVPEAESPDCTEITGVSLPPVMVTVTVVSPVSLAVPESSCAVTLYVSTSSSPLAR